MSCGDGALPGLGRGGAPRPNELIMVMVMIVIVSRLLPENFSRQISFAVGIYIHFGRRNSGSHDFRNLQPRTDIERRYRVFQKLWRHSGIYQRA